MMYPTGEEGDETEDGMHDVYEGRMEHGMREGKGTYTWKNGSTFTGNYRQNLKSGEGAMTLPDGSKYEGLQKRALTVYELVLRQGDLQMISSVVMERIRIRTEIFTMESGSEERSMEKESTTAR
mgnify:CR=1 FL=1